MTHTIKPLDEGDVGGRRVMRPPHSLDVIRAIEKKPTPPAEPGEAPKQRLTIPRHPGIDLSTYIFLPGQEHDGIKSSDLVVARDLLCYGQTWEESQSTVNDTKGAVMLTPRQFVDLLNMLRRAGTVFDGNFQRMYREEKIQCYREIVGTRNNWEWLNATFTNVGPYGLSIRSETKGESYETPLGLNDLLHITSPSSHVLLPFGGGWLEHATAQGLPPKRLGVRTTVQLIDSMGYMPPLHNCAARFGVFDDKDGEGDKIFLYCNAPKDREINDLDKTGIRLAFYVDDLVRAPTS